MKSVKVVTLYGIACALVLLAPLVPAAQDVWHAQARLSNGASQFVYTGGDWMTSATPRLKSIALADVNGDGKADLIVQYDTPDGVRHWQARLSDGVSHFVFTGNDWTMTGTPGVTAIGLADVNRDGKADLILQYDTPDGVRHWQARLSDGVSHFVFTGDDWTMTGTPGVAAIGLADANGDGKADLILQYDTPDGVRRWQARLSDGVSRFVFTGNDWTTTRTLGVTAVGLADVSGDHLQDLVLQYPMFQYGGGNAFYQEFNLSYCNPFNPGETWHEFDEGDVRLSDNSFQLFGPHLGESLPLPNLPGVVYDDGSVKIENVRKTDNDELAASKYADHVHYRVHLWASCGKSAHRYVRIHLEGRKYQ